MFSISSIFGLVSGIVPNLKQYVAWIVGAIIIVILAYFGWSYNSLQNENTLLQIDKERLENNQEQIINAYEESIRLIEKVSVNEALNSEAKINNDKSKVKLTKAIEKRGKIDVEDNSVFTVFTF